MKRTPPTANPQSIGDFDSMRSLAAGLQRKFGEQLRVTLDPDMIRDWRQGNRLPPNAPPPPPKRDGHFKGMEWSQWVKKWVVPFHGHKTDATEVSLAELAQRAKFKTQIIEEQKSQIELDIVSGKYLTKDSVGRAMTNLAAAMNSVMNSALHGRARVALREKFAALNIAVDVQTLDVICAHLSALNLELKTELRATLATYENEE